MNDIVTVTNDKPMTTSLIVAEKFDKQHKNVMQSIDNIISTLESIGGDALSFQAVEIIEKNALGGTYKKKHYVMDRDAFSVLVFGFNGPQALKFKVDFIKEFNRLELELMKARADLMDLSDPARVLRMIADTINTRMVSFIISATSWASIKKRCASYSTMISGA